MASGDADAGDTEETEKEAGGRWEAETMEQEAIGGAEEEEEEDDDDDEGGCTVCGKKCKNTIKLHC